MTKGKIWKMPLISAAFGLVLALTLTACGDNGNGGGGPGFLGDTLNLRGRVYLADGDYYNIRWTRFNGTRTVPSNLGVAGEVVNGQFSFTMDRPSTGDLRPVRDVLGWFGVTDSYYDDLSVAPAAAMGARLRLKYNLSRANVSISATSERHDIVYFIFVDREVTISGVGITELCECSDCDCTEYDGACYCDTITTRTFNITLNEGWNALHLRYDYVITNNHYYITMAISHGEPGGLRWFFDSCVDGWDYDWNDWYDWD